MTLLKSEEEGYRYWGVIGCIQLGDQAATPEVLGLMDEMIRSDLGNVKTLDLRATAAFYLHQIGHERERAVSSLKEVAGLPKSKYPASGRAIANLKLLGLDWKSGIPTKICSTELIVCPPPTRGHRLR